MRLIILLLSFSLFACGNSEAPSLPYTAKDTVPTIPVTISFVNPAGTTIPTRFPTPDGYTRTAYIEDAFGHYLRHQPLKPHGTKVLLFNGVEKGNQRAHAAVLDVDVGNRDLQQCADAVMRLRAEYLYEQERFADIHFNFVSGFNAEYARWRKGQRIRVKGNRVDWTPGSGATPDYKSFRKYLTMVFSYAGTASLVHELKPKDKAYIDAGDVLIKGGSPGHAVIVVDKAVNETTGEVLVLLAQSYMPAQDIHVLVNPAHRDGNPWYSVTKDFGDWIQTAEYGFDGNALRSF
ncbi:DUF4846 domain-containing protein [Neolewinella persica]|uniref:DUF4846 domain-containing protein n=1 Tax=Neolewinella persica TaxID=70998 RepID=UPI00036E0322|nr:DUF4846 domain-containing protein [Neolewinella persica]